MRTFRVRAVARLYYDLHINAESREDAINRVWDEIGYDGNYDDSDGEIVDISEVQTPQSEESTLIIPVPDETEPVPVVSDLTSQLLSMAQEEEPPDDPDER